MKLIFLGPPGAGKGTQAGKVAKALNVPHLSTGDMLRSSVAKLSPVGLKAKAYMDAGKLVPDSVVIEMVKERLGMDDCEAGYLLDGFPRTVDQAMALEEICAPDAVINIHVEDERLLKRLTGRRVCHSCKGTFHVDTLSDPLLCPVCGDGLIHRADDQLGTISNRLHVYHEQTAPLIEYYGAKRILSTVDGSKPMDEVAEEIFAALECS